MGFVKVIHRVAVQVQAETPEDSRSRLIFVQVISDIRKAMEKLPQVYKHGFQSISVQLVASFVCFFL